MLRRRPRDLGWVVWFGFGRYVRLGGHLLVGRVARVRRSSWWPVAFPLALAVAMPLAVALLLRVLGSDVPVDKYFTVANIALALLFLVALFGISRARHRVVIQPFIDYTAEEEKAVSGLATLLVTELGRLRELYQEVNELSVPTAVGFERSGGFDRAKDAASFLTVSADQGDAVLEGVVASDASIGAGPLRIPLGPLIAMVNRLTRGPRVVGTVHLTEAGGGPTLTAQLVGAPRGGTWRVDEETQPQTAEQRQAFLDTMVRELACRMFAELALGGEIRWKAVWAFNDYLQLYRDSQRTPRDRARYLKQAQGKLMAAVAEDERFELAYYNLGVIYTHLAEAERNAERLSQDVTSRANIDRERMDVARAEAARSAFTRAADRNPELWQAYYALAVTRFSTVKSEVDIVDPAPGDGAGGRRSASVAAHLRDVIRYCDHACDVAVRYGAGTAAARDLKGMAQTRLGKDLDRALETHRRAVAEFWREYCAARRRRASRLDPGDRGVATARRNAAAALSNLALAHERRARVREPAARPRLTDDQRLDLRVADLVFRRVLRLAGEGSEQAAACHFERGVVLDRLDEHEAAACEYERAQRIHPANCEYAARRARSLALAARRGGAEDEGSCAEDGTVANEADEALRVLAAPFRVAISPWAPPAIDKHVDVTLAAVAEAPALRGQRTERTERIRSLKTVLSASARATDDRLDEAIREVGAYRDEPAGDWESAQVERALAHLLARKSEWKRAEEVLAGLVKRIEEEPGSIEVVDVGVYAHHARALRELDRFHDALAAAAECVRRDPLNVEGLREAGRAHVALRQYPEALRSWTNALSLSPSDPYLHYEVAMCHRRLAAESPPGAQRDREAEQAIDHFSQALELFDGEDLHGEAWVRLWMGRTALEAGDTHEAARHLAAAEHGSACAAASLLLGEALLARGERVAAERAFRRCLAALQPGSIATLPHRTTIDAGWGDELPMAAVRARVKRGLVEARTSAARDLDPVELEAQLADLRAAHDELASVDDDPARDAVEATLLESEARLLIDAGRGRDALMPMRKRLRFDASPAALRLERAARAAALSDGGAPAKEPAADRTRPAPSEARERGERQPSGSHDG